MRKARSGQKQLLKFRGKRRPSCKMQRGTIFCLHLKKDGNRHHINLRGCRVTYIEVFPASYEIQFKVTYRHQAYIGSCIVNHDRPELDGVVLTINNEQNI